MQTMGKVTDWAFHPLELKSAIILKCLRQPLFPLAESSLSVTKKRCYELLNLTSRSFAAVIKELHPELRDVIMIFYLVLRALDTIEDDMTLDTKLKMNLLREFDQKLDLQEWSFDGNGPDEKDRAVLVDFNYILYEYHALKPEYQKVIKEVTKEMGNGMADYIIDENFNLNGVETIKDYDKYCHYVAGLVGVGLTQLIVIAGFAPKSLYEDEKDAELPLYESMGCLLYTSRCV